MIQIQINFFFDFEILFLNFGHLAELPDIVLVGKTKNVKSKVGGLTQS
jgi:hypothetical protein